MAVFPATFELASRLPAAGLSEVEVIAPLYINNYLKTDSARSGTHGRYVPYDFILLPQVVGLATESARCSVRLVERAC